MSKKLKFLKKLTHTDTKISRQEFILQLGPLLLLPCLLVLLLPSNHLRHKQTIMPDMISLYFSPSYRPSTQPHCFLSLWMKEEVQRRLKCKESSVCSVSLLDRSDTTADNNNNNNDSDKRRCRIIHEGWRTQPQRSSVSTKLTHSAACVFSKPSRSWVTTPNLCPPRRDFPLNGAHLVWERKTPN